MKLYCGRFCKMYQCYLHSAHNSDSEVSPTGPLCIHWLKGTSLGEGKGEGAEQAFSTFRKVGSVFANGISVCLLMTSQYHTCLTGGIEVVTYCHHLSQSNLAGSSMHHTEQYVTKRGISPGTFLFVSFCRAAVGFFLLGWCPNSTASCLG